MPDATGPSVQLENPADEVYYWRATEWLHEDALFPCSFCHGFGFVNVNVCQECRGTGVIVDD